MKLIKKGLTILDAKALADRLALETGRVHSVRTTNRNPMRTSFYVVEGMVGNLVYARYTARPETLKFKRPKGNSKNEKS